MPVLYQDGVKFNYVDQGSGRPVVFLHGLGADINHALGVLKQIPNVRAVSLEMRGHGRTSLGPASRISFQQFATDVVGLMDHLGISRAVVGGISMGSCVALKTALMYPGRVEGLIIVRPAWTHEGMTPLACRLYPLVYALMQEYGPVEAKRIYARLVRRSPLYKDQPAALSAALNLFANRAARLTSIKYIQMAKDTPLAAAEELKAVTQPTLVVANTRDFIHPAGIAEYFAAHLPNAELRYIVSRSVSRRGHQLELVEVVKSFVESLS